MKLVGGVLSDVVLLAYIMQSQVSEVPFLYLQRECSATGEVVSLSGRSHSILRLQYKVGLGSAAWSHEGWGSV